MIRLKNVQKFFNKGRQNQIHVINNVSIELAERGMVAIFGQSGCGKTTLLNVIGGLDKFESGSIEIDGKQITQGTDELRNRYVGYIFQNYNLNKTISCYDNVADALRLCGMNDGAEMEDRVMAALRNVGMENYSNRTPDTLSGGQQQRIAIARAIVKNPRIILADEPTGNLDEANTVLIMDLLKAISKDHLVLLVTHEANLVDYYCDTVIELKDGKVEKIRSNTVSMGYHVKDKNHIYLGEMEKTTLTDPHAEVDFYGDLPEEPLKLRIVNRGGKLFLKVDSKQVQILEDASEIKLIDGVFEQGKENAPRERQIDMSALPPIKGTRFGKLFSVRSSIKSGFETNFKSKKRRFGKKLLHACLGMFAADIVLASSIFGTLIFGTMEDIHASYSHNTFYVYTKDGEISDRLHAAAADPKSAIDYLTLYRDFYEVGDREVEFALGSFETFTSGYSTGLKTNAVFLDETMCRDLPLTEGRRDALQENEVLISTAVAEALLESSTYGYLEDHRDLLGLIMKRYSLNGRNLRVVGIVESKEKAIYFSELGMAKLSNLNANLHCDPASDFDMNVEEGSVILTVGRNVGNEEELPKVGDKVQIMGHTFTVKQILRQYADYYGWLEVNGIKKLNEDEYFRDLLKKEYPTLTEDDTEYWEKYQQVHNERYVDYFKYYYDADFDAFLSHMYRFQPDERFLWLWMEKGVPEARFSFMPGGEHYYFAEEYRKQYGKYPTREELDRAMSSLPSLYEELDVIWRSYEHEYFRSYPYILTFSSETGYLLNDRDYILISKRIGDTDPTASGYRIYFDSIYKETGKGVVVDTDMSYVSYASAYTLLHSNDPDATAAYLDQHFSDLEGERGLSTVVGPKDLYDEQMDVVKLSIVGAIVSMSSTFLVMCICMYFIMRASLMNRIKEIGIYRAIGVSKKNLIFKFLVEAFVLATLTVFVGYLLSSAFIFACIGASSLLEGVFFYPVWLAGIVLMILYALCLFFGVLPIVTLLRKTPSEILAKYDI